MRRRPPSFADLLDPLYASILEAARFDDFAVGLRLVMDSHLVSLQVDNESHDHHIKQHFAGTSLGALPARLQDDARVNQYFLRGASQLISEGVLNGTPLFASGELERTAFYQDALVPVDVLHSMGALLSSSHSRELTALTVSRDKHRPAFDKIEMQLLQRLLPHLRNVYALQHRLQHLQQMAASLDHLVMGVWLLDGQGKVVHANLPAHQMLGDRNSGLRQRNLQLTASWRADRRDFQQAIESATLGFTRSCAEWLLHDAKGQPWAVVSLRPLHAVSFDAWALPAQTVALLFLRPFSERSPAPVESLRRVFSLTRAEADLACALLQHGSLAACRDALGKSSETLRSQLKALFAKTRTCRQAELLQRLRSVSGA